MINNFKLELKNKLSVRVLDFYDMVSRFQGQTHDCKRTKIIEHKYPFPVYGTNCHNDLLLLQQTSKTYFKLHIEEITVLSINLGYMSRNDIKIKKVFFHRIM